MTPRLAASIDELALHEGSACVSILFPVDPRHLDEHRDVLTVRNLVEEAGRRFDAFGVGHAGLLDVDIVELRRRAMALGCSGVAVYRSPGYDAEVMVASPVGPTVTVGDRFHVLPLVAIGAGGWRGHVLTVGGRGVALYKAVDGSLEPCPTVGLPTRSDDVLGPDKSERQSGAHTAGPAGRQGEATMHHGLGGREDDRKGLIEHYFRLVDDAVSEAIGPDDPLLVIGTVTNVAHFRAVTRHQVVDGLALGSPSELTVDQLAAGVAGVAEAQHTRQVDEQLARYAALAGTGLATADRQELAAAAAAGRVELLRLGAALTRPTGEPSAPDAALDAANRTVIDARRTGAVVMIVDREQRPEAPALAGILRY